MPSANDGIMVILSSPSGAGKTTLVKKLSGKDNFEISISHTTRQPRLNENQDEDYFFVDEFEFKKFSKKLKVASTISTFTLNFATPSSKALVSGGGGGVQLITTITTTIEIIKFFIVIYLLVKNIILLQFVKPFHLHQTNL